MPASMKLYSVTLDCPDPPSLVEFYRELTGMKISFASEEFAGLEGDGGTAIGFQQVADYQPPEWPGQSVPQQFHLDFAVDNLDDAEADVLELGASKADAQPNPDRWRVFLDPAGHPFCLVAM